MPNGWKLEGIIFWSLVFIAIGIIIPWSIDLIQNLPESWKSMTFGCKYPWC